MTFARARFADSVRRCVDACSWMGIACPDPPLQNPNQNLPWLLRSLVAHLVFTKMAVESRQYPGHTFVKCWTVGRYNGSPLTLRWRENIGRCQSFKVLAMAFYFANTSIEYENKGKTTEVVCVRFRKSGQMKSFFEIGRHLKSVQWEWEFKHVNRDVPDFWDKFNWKAPQVGAVGMRG